MGTDRIEKQVLLHAPLDRVWRAISDSREFGLWFGVRVDGPFVAGTSVTATLTGTAVDEEVAAMQRPHAGAKATWQVVTVQPPRQFAYRWHPFAVEANVDYATEPTTLVEFTLTETSEGVLLSIVESGFDAIGETRRADAFEANRKGWSKQTELVRKYLLVEQRV
jgi:uncharacterized protein YndB with AHSA1/START domain